MHHLIRVHQIDISPPRNVQEMVTLLAVLFPVLQKDKVPDILVIINKR
ncbi:hypothetical protein X975_00929, partial [Stegodyphus mimosarum]